LGDRLGLKHDKARNATRASHEGATDLQLLELLANPWTTTIGKAANASTSTNPRACSTA
jgi:hypothetical protein